MSSYPSDWCLALLNRTELVEMRRDRLGLVMQLADAVLVGERRRARGEKLTGDEERALRKCKDLLRARAEQSAEYCAMMRAAIDPALVK